MDRSLNELIPQLAHNLLSPSSSLECFVPISQQNGIYSLAILSGLGDIAHQSLKLVAPPAPAALQTAQATSKTPPAKSKDQALLDALMALRNSNRGFSRKSGIYTPILRMDSTS